MVTYVLTLTRSHWLASIAYPRSCIGPGIPNALTSGATISEEKPDKEEIRREALDRAFGRRINPPVLDRGSGGRSVIGLCSSRNA